MDWLAKQMLGGMSAPMRIVLRVVFASSGPSFSRGVCLHRPGGGGALIVQVTFGGGALYTMFAWKHDVVDGRSRGGDARVHETNGRGGARRDMT